MKAIFVFVVVCAFSVSAAGDGLDENVIEAVKTCRFAPATKDGVPVAVAMYIEVDYQLGEGH